MFSKIMITKSTENCWAETKRLQQALAEAEAVVIGAGAGFSSAANPAASKPLKMSKVLKQCLSSRKLCEYRRNCCQFALIAASR